MRAALGAARGETRLTQLAAAAARHPLQPHDSLLRVAGLRTEFDTPYGVIRAVDGVDFTLARGSALGIVGESGSGKSVLARSILGLLPSNASVRCRGEIVFDSVDLTRLSEKDIAKGTDFISSQSMTSTLYQTSI